MEYEQREDEITRLREQLATVAAHLHQIEHARQLDAHQIQNLTQASALQNVLSQGLEAIREQLQPLRDMSPRRNALNEADQQKLRSLREDSERPTWNGDASAEQHDWTTAITRRKLHDSRAR